jgi:hypothetical protein
MSWKGFLSRIFGRDADEDETRVYSAGEIGTRGLGEKEFLRGFTFERAAKIISDLPPDVPRESAVRIVRGTLTAAGIEVEDIERSTQTRESQLNSDIEHARSRRQDLRKRTEEVVRSLEEEIRKAREDRETGIAEEEEKISRAVRGLEEVKRVRAFFGFPETEGEETADLAGVPNGDETQVLEPFDADRTQARQRPGPLTDPDATAENASYSPHATTDER